jgi:hypothetical protein
VATPLALTQIEHMVGLSGCDNNEGEYFARESGKCPYHSGDADIATFSSADNAKRWLSTAKQYGGVYLVGGNFWAVKLDSVAAAKSFQRLIGGRVQ